jgi:hypothetical protein
MAAELPQTSLDKRVENNKAARASQPTARTGKSSPNARASGGDTAPAFVYLVTRELRKQPLLLLVGV